MNRRVLMWLVPVILMAVASVSLYRYMQAAPDRAVASDASSAPMMISSLATRADREHEVKALLGELEKNPDHVPILMRLAQVSRNAGKLNDSIRYLKEAVAQDSKNTDASLELGRVLFETGDVSGAIRATEHALEINPLNVDAIYNLGAIYGNLSQDQRAREYWQKAVALAPDSDSGRRAEQNLQKLR